MMNKDSALRRWLRSTRQGYNLLEVAIAVTLLSTISAGAGVTAVNAKAEYDHSQNKTTIQTLIGAISMDAGARSSLYNPTLIPLYAEGGRNAVSGVTSITLSPFAQSNAVGEVAAVLSEDRQILSMAMVSTKDRCLLANTVNGIVSDVTSRTLADGVPCRPILTEAVLTEDSTPLDQTASALSAMQIAAGRIQFSWSTVGGAAVYLLTVEGQPDSYCIESAPSTSCILEFAAGTYTATVDAQNASGFAPQSERISFVVSTPPETPFMTGNADTPARAALAWDEPNDNNATISSYLVEYQRDGAASWNRVPIQDPAVRTLELKPLEDGLYRFRISAENALGFSAMSETLVLDIAELQAPTNVEAGSDADGMTVDYEVSDNQEIDSVEYSTDGGQTWQPLPMDDGGGVDQTAGVFSNGQLFLTNGPANRFAGLRKNMEEARQRAMSRAQAGRAAPRAEALLAPACAAEGDMFSAGRSGQRKAATCSIRTGSNGSPMTPGVAAQVVLRTRLGDVVSAPSAAASAAPLNLPQGLVGYAAPAGGGTVEVASSFGVVSGQSVTFEADGSRIYRITSQLHPQSEDAGELLEHRIARNGTDIQGSTTDRKHLDLFRTDPVFGHVTRQREDPRSRQETYQSGTRKIYEDRWLPNGQTHQHWEAVGTQQFWEKTGTTQVYTGRTAVYRVEYYVVSVPYTVSVAYQHYYTVSVPYTVSVAYQESYSWNHVHTSTQYYACGWLNRSTCSRQVSSNHTHWGTQTRYRNETRYRDETRSQTRYRDETRHRNETHQREVFDSWNNHYRTDDVYGYVTYPRFGWVDYPTYAWMSTHVRTDPVYSTRTVNYTVTVDFQNWEQVGTQQVKTGTKLNTDVKTDSLVTFDVPSAGTVTYTTRARIAAGAGAPNIDRSVAPALLVEDMGPANGVGQVGPDAPAAGVVAVASPQATSSGYSSAGNPVAGQSVTFTAEEGRRYMIVSSARPLSQGAGNTATHQIRSSKAVQPLANSQVALPNRENSANSTIVAYDVPGAGTVTYGTHLAFSAGASGTNRNFADSVNRPLIAVIDVGPAGTLPLARVSRFPSGLAAVPVTGSAITVTSAGERVYRVDVAASFSSGKENDRVRLELIREIGSDQTVIQSSMLVASRNGTAANGYFSAIDFSPTDSGVEVVYRVRAVYVGAGSGRNVSTMIAVDDLGLGTVEGATIRSVLAPLR